MARLITVGYEVEAPGNALAGPENPNAGARSGTLVRNTSVQRSGAGCLSCDSGASNLIARYTLFTPAPSTTYYIRCFFQFTGVPTFGNTDILGTITAAGVRARLTIAGKLRFSSISGGVQIGSDSAATLVANTWYRVEMQIVLNASTQVTDGELRLDGVTVASFTGQTWAATGDIAVGWHQTPGADLSLLVDDVAVNNSTGAENNTWPGDGKVILMSPTSDGGSGAGWTRGNGTAIASNAFASLDNTPPVGIADLGGAGADTGQLRNAASNANSAVLGVTNTYTAAGIGASDTINAVVAWVCTAAPVTTSAKQGTFGFFSNPSATLVALGAGGTSGAFWSGVAAGTYPTGWKWSSTAATAAQISGLTRGSGCQLSINQVTASTRIAMVCFLGPYVDYTPTAAATPSLIWNPAPPTVMAL